MKKFMNQVRNGIGNLTGFELTDKYKISLLLTKKARPQRAHSDYMHLHTIKDAENLPWLVHVPLTEEGAYINVWPGPFMYREDPKDANVNNHDDLPKHAVRVFIPFGMFLCLRADVVHGGAFGGCGNTRLHIALNLSRPIERDYLEMGLAATGATLNFFRPFRHFVEEYKLPSPPTFSASASALFRGLQQLAIIHRSPKERERLIEERNKEYAEEMEDEEENNSDDTGRDGYDDKDNVGGIPKEIVDLKDTPPDEHIVDDRKGVGVYLKDNHPPDDDHLSSSDSEDDDDEEYHDHD